MSTTTASVDPAANHGSPRANRGRTTRARTPAASGTRTTSAKRPSSSDGSAVAASEASTPMKSGPSVAAATKEPASAPSASAASPPASATRPTAATSVDDSPRVSTPSRTGLSNSRLSVQASGTSTANGNSDSARTVFQRLRSSHSSLGAIPSAVSTTSAASTRSPRAAASLDGCTSASATASSASGSRASATRSATRARLTATSFVLTQGVRGVYRARAAASTSAVSNAPSRRPSSRPLRSSSTPAGWPGMRYALTDGPARARRTCRSPGAPRPVR